LCFSGVLNKSGFYALIQGAKMTNPKTAQLEEELLAAKDKISALQLEITKYKNIANALGFDYKIDVALLEIPKLRKQINK
jgi:hypothetical protein